MTLGRSTFAKFNSLKCITANTKPVDHATATFKSDSNFVNILAKTKTVVAYGRGGEIKMTRMSSWTVAV